MRRQLIGPAVALAAVVPALLDQPSLDESGTAWRLMALWAVASLACGVLMVARPAVATIGCFAALAAVELTASAADVELSFLDLAPTAACLFMAGALAGRRTVALLAGVVVVGTAAGTVVNRLTADASAQGGLDVLAGLLTLALALVGGLALRAQRERLDVERRLRALGEREAAASERARIAREMHDVVAHSVTLLVVNAETLRARRSELPPWAADQADAMAEAGRRASGEMRTLLRLLRTDEPEPGAAPGLDELPLLVREAARAGTAATLSEEGERVPVPTTTALTAYRVVQECLSNARRHAPGAAVAVRLVWGGDDLAIEVTTAATDARPSTDGAGAGIAGMRERVAESGGLIRTARTEAGHRVDVTLPTGGPRG